MKITNQRGISVIEAIVAAGIFGIVAMMTTSATMHTATVSSDKSSTQTQVLLSVRRKIGQLINNDYLWVQTAALAGTNSALNCTNTSTLTPCVSTPGPLNLSLIDETGAVSFYETGFTYAGQKCPLGQTFLVAGNDQCPFKYVVTYQITCPAGPSCFFPLVQISAQLQYSPVTRVGIGIDIAHYQITNLMRTTSTAPAAHVYECFDVSYGGGPAAPGTNGQAKVLNPGNTFPPADFSQVSFNPPVGRIWSVTCVPGWQARGCAISEPAVSGFPDMDHWLDANATGTGCFSDDHQDFPTFQSEWTANATLSTSCCRVR